MAYIGKVKVSDTWESLADLIQAQVEGQSAFAFGSSTYQLQGEGPVGVRFADASSAPTDNEDGERIANTQVAIYEPSTGTLYVKAEVNTPEGQWVKISELA